MDNRKQFVNPIISDELSISEETLENLGLTTFELLTFCRLPEDEGARRMARRISCPINEAGNFLHQIRKEIVDYKATESTAHELDNKISTGLSALDSALSGGITRGTITEVFGSSGTGKSQFLLQMVLRAQLQCNERGIVGKSIYISTESALETRRLSEMTDSDSSLTSNALENISYIYCQDGESQDHILFTQLPSKLKASQDDNENITIVVIDSIGHHFRLKDSYINNVAYLRNYLEQQEEKLDELPSYLFLRSEFDTTTERYFKGHSSFRDRNLKTLYLLDLYRHLSHLARLFNVAIIVANQVSDVFEHEGNRTNSTEETDPLSFTMQVGTYSGWKVVTTDLIQPNVRSYPRNFQDNNAAKEDNVISKRIRLQDNILESNHFPEFSMNPPRKILALGYTWAKLITNKILLWKVHTPCFEVKGLAIEKNNMIHPTMVDTEDERKNVDLFERMDSLEDWVTMRFMTVISPNTSQASHKGNRIPFTISKEGLVEV